MCVDVCGCMCVCVCLHMCGCACACLTLLWRPSATLVQYDAFLEDVVADRPDSKKVVAVNDIFGFFMGFRKDQVVADSRENILLRGGQNLHQGTLPATSSSTRGAVAYTCTVTGSSLLLGRAW